MIISDKTQSSITLFEEDYRYPKSNWQTLKSGSWRGWMIWLIHSGSGSVRFHSTGKTHRLIPGAAVFFPLETNCDWTYEPSKPLANYIFFFDLFDADGKRLEALEQTEYRYHFFPDDTFVKELIDRFKTAYEDSDEALYTFWLRAIVNEILEESNRHESQAESGLKARLDHVLELAVEQPEQRFTVRDLAEKMGCSPDHFTRLCKKNRNASPLELIIGKRIEKAKKLLIESYDDIATIADKLGYKNQFFFSRQFKQKTGLPPLEFQKIARGFAER